jgi:hypothetical protein
MSTGSLLDKKLVKILSVLTEEKLDETGAGLNTSQKSLRRLALEIGISK